MIDALLELVVSIGLTLVAGGLVYFVTRPTPKRHTWGELDSSHVAASFRRWRQ